MDMSPEGLNPMDTTRIIPRIRAKAFVSDEGTLEDLAADKARVKVFPWVHQAPEVCPEEVVRSQEKAEREHPVLRE